MTSFEYKPISLTAPAFRLLRLLKGDDDPIQCQLFESKLAAPEAIGDYAALSYTWGSTFRPCDITMNGSNMSVTKNAYLALRDLRYKEKDRVLWIDVLCIDQSNVEERGQQVQQMGSIYGKAERVIIWLGEATYDTDYVMHYMKQLEKDVIEHTSNDWKVSDEQLVEIWLAVIHHLRDDQKDLLREGLRSLLDRSWFKRVWIIQETANARAAEIVCGGKSILSSTFAVMPSLLEITPPPHCQPILDIMPGPIRNSSWWAEKRDLHTMLIQFCNSEATDPRDNIYALLDISSDAHDTELLKANYGSNLRDVIFDTVSFILNFNGLDSPICCFFDWTLPKFIESLNVLANEVLKCAMDTGQETLVKLLLMRDDVDVNIEVDDKTPLSWAARNGHEAVIKLLLEGNAYVNLRDMDRRTPLLWAARNGHEAVVKLFLKSKANVDLGDWNDRTPLSWAAENGHEAVVKLLLEGKAHVNLADRNGRTPLSWAAENGHEAVVKLLLEGKAKRVSLDENCRTPLLWAARNGHEAAVKMLLEDDRSSVDLWDTSFRTPLQWAEERGHEGVAKLLKSYNAR
jgi:ankyrin repeat protein